MPTARTRKPPKIDTTGIKRSLIGGEVVTAASALSEAKDRRDEAIRAAVTLGLSLREVADLAGISHGTVANIVNREDEG